MEPGQPFKDRVDYWRAFPKVELHRHLEGSLRLSTLHEWICQDFATKPSLTEVKENWLITKQEKDLSTVLHRFLKTRDLLSSSERITRMAFECVEDAYEDGIKHLELRYSPTFLSEKSLIPWEQALQAIYEGFKKASHLPIQLGLIGIIQRTSALSLSQKVMEFFKSYRDFFIGLDLADDEVCRPTEDFQDLFKNCAFPLTIHSGEAVGSQANVKAAIEKLGAQRIGHGLQIIHEKPIMELVQKQKVTLELCPTSNVITSAVKIIDEHPFRQFLEAGIRCTVNSDDPGIFNITLSHEFALLEKSLGFSETEFKVLTDTALRASFLKSSI
jgi:adenosine deaminase